MNNWEELKQTSIAAIASMKAIEIATNYTKKEIEETKDRAFQRCKDFFENDIANLMRSIDIQKFQNHQNTNDISRDYFETPIKGLYMCITNMPGDMIRYDISFGVGKHLTNFYLKCDSYEALKKSHFDYAMKYIDQIIKSFPEKQIEWELAIKDYVVNTISQGIDRAVKEHETILNEKENLDW